MQSVETSIIFPSGNSNSALEDASVYFTLADVSVYSTLAYFTVIVGYLQFKPLVSRYHISTSLTICLYSPFIS